MWFAMGFFTSILCPCLGLVLFGRFNIFCCLCCISCMFFSYIWLRFVSVILMLRFKTVFKTFFNSLPVQTRKRHGFRSILFSTYVIIMCAEYLPVEVIKYQWISVKFVSRWLSPVSNRTPKGSRSVPERKLLTSATLRVLNGQSYHSACARQPFRMSSACICGRVAEGLPSS